MTGKARRQQRARARAAAYREFYEGFRTRLSEVLDAQMAEALGRMQRVSQVPLALMLGENLKAGANRWVDQQVWKVTRT